MPGDFCWERRVEFSETDAAGIVHFSSLIIYMEQAEHALLRSLGLSVAPSATSNPRVSGEQLSWPRVRVEVDFQSPARFEDVLQAVVSVHSLGRTSVTYSCKLSLGDRVIAKGKMTSVCCRREDGGLKAVEIPSGIRDLLKTFLDVA